MIISFSGPSGIGKGFIKERLLCLYPHVKELSWITTRFLRSNENHGNRIHVSSAKFDQLVILDKIVLMQSLYGHRYGLMRDDLSQSGIIKLTELHPSNLREAFKINPEIIAIGFITPNLSFLYDRLSIIRKTESLSEIKKRIEAAKIEIKTILDERVLFTSIIEVTKVSENSIFEQVFTILNPYLKEKGDSHVS